jgi:hypothetical protein
VHGQNVSNRVRGVRVCPTAYRSQFPGLLDEVPVVDVATRTVDRTLRAPARGAGELVRGACKRVVLSTLGKDGLDRAKQRVKGRR